MINILIADDEYIELEYLQMILGKYPKEFKLSGKANNGRDAVKVGMNTPIDVAILDISMPFKNGIEVGRILKTFHPALSVILNSAYSEFDYARDALKYGFDDYLIKPTTEEKIINTIRKVTSKKKIEGEKNIPISKKLDFSKISNQLITVLFTFNECALKKELVKTKAELIKYCKSDQKYFLQIFILLLETTLKEYNFDTTEDFYSMILKNSTYQLEQNIDIDVIIKDIINSYKESILTKDKKGFFDVEKVIDFIDNNYTNPDLSLSFLSNIFFVNSSYLSRTFSQSTNLTLTTYIRNKRLERAKSLCLETELTIEEISILSGFKNKQQFYKYFYDTYHKTPLEMRSENYDS